MKIEKNKIIMAAVLLCIVLFIVGYTVHLMGSDDTVIMENHQMPLPQLEEGQKTYESKLEALNDLKEVRQTNAPSIYDERLLDSTGVYDSDLLDIEKMRMIDSIYKQGRIQYTTRTLEKDRLEPIQTTRLVDTLKPAIKSVIKPVISAKELGLEHQLFFASNPKEWRIDKALKVESSLIVVVDGTQTVKTHHRLRMRVKEAAVMNGIAIPRNTPIYGLVSFRPNRTLVTIENIQHQPVKLKAFDMQDGLEGIYIENSFQAEASREVVQEVVQDINIAGLPQVGGVKRLFQRDNRTIKVTVLNHYQLILKQQP